MVVSIDFFERNRQQLARKLRGGLIILTGYSAMQRGNDAAFPFEQEANFWYVTGIEQPGWQVIIDGTSHESWLIAPAVDVIHQLFDGSLSYDDAKKISGITKVLSADEGLTMQRALAKKHSVVYTVDELSREHLNFTLNPALRLHKRSLERIFNAVHDCHKELARLRAIKQPVEIDAIKKAIRLTINSFDTVRQQLNEYRYEYEIEADFTHSFGRKAGAGHAYDPIIASGKNACTLHYSHNTARLRSRQLVLMDVGARHGGYAADITRTYVRGEPTKRMQAVHAAVESAHQQIIALLEPNLSVEQYQHDVEVIMAAALESLGLPVTDLRQYFPHAVSHGLGIDVHDSLGQPRYFEPGMVLTVEPGIYIPEEGIGVRIEDDILITETGRTNLSAALSTGLY